MDDREFVKASTRGGFVVGAAVASRYVIMIGTQVALARILDPEHFGQVAFAGMVAMFFNNFTNTYGDKYVIQERKDPKTRLDNVFTLELILSTFFVLLVCLLSPFVMRLLGKEDLTLTVQLLSFAFFYNPLGRTKCLLERDLSFFRSKFPMVLSQFFAALIAITMAYYRFGVWSLVGWRLSILFGEVIILGFVASYRPRLRWNKEIIKDILRFGWPLMGSGFLTYIYYNIDYYIIGQTLEDGNTQLGYYYLGFQMSNYFLLSRQVIFDVLFPIFSRVREDGRKSRFFQKITRAVGGVFLLPSLAAFFFGRDIILLAFGSKWEPAVLPFQIIFLSILLRAISSNIGYYLYSRNITRPQFEVSLLYVLLLTPLAYFMTRTYGINGTAASVVIVNFITMYYAFQRYIKPLTGKSVNEFLLAPCSIALAAFGVMLLGERIGAGFSLRLGAFAFFLLPTYLFIFRQVISDLKDARLRLKSGPDNSEK